MIADNVGGHLMQHGMVDLCIVGTDRTTRAGDVANKIGTYLKALAAQDNGVPFYVALPSTDHRLDDRATASAIPIEQRGAERGQRDARPDRRRAHRGCGSPRTAARPATGRSTSRRRGWSPALITERGVCDASEQGLAVQFPEQADRMSSPYVHGAWRPLKAARCRLSRSRGRVSCRRTSRPLAMITTAPSKVTGSGTS